MKKMDGISISRIATIISNNSIIKTNSNSTWERILSNAGQQDHYNTFSGRLNPYKYYKGYQNPNDVSVKRN